MNTMHNDVAFDDTVLYRARLLHPLQDEGQSVNRIRDDIQLDAARILQVPFVQYFPVWNRSRAQASWKIISCSFAREIA